MPRLIVRLHKHLEAGGDGNYLCWYDGAFLVWESTRAYVRALPKEKRIEIRITGMKKRELLAIVRMTLGEINKGFHKIVIEQRIPCRCSPECTFFFDYEVLCRFEVKGEPRILCNHSTNYMEVEKLLNGIETKSKEDRKTYYIENNYGGINMGDKYINEGQAGNLGRYNKIDHNTMSQIQPSPLDDMNFQELAAEIRALKDVLQKRVSEDAHYEAMAGLVAAEKAALAGDKDGVKESLKRGGIWALDAAKSVGYSIVANALTFALT
jgi:hypothetical protein